MEIKGMLEDKLYCYPGTNVLKNKLDIHDQLTLQIAERVITSEREAQLFANDKLEINGFGLNTLRRIHAYLFGPIYSWAGKTRKVNISKKGVAFESPENIAEKIMEVRKYIREKNYFKEMDDGEKIKNLALVHSTLNSIHPFREGNGRTIRVFMQLLSSRSGWELDWNAVNKATQDKAAEQARDGDLTNLALVYSRLAYPVEEGSKANLSPKVIIKKEPSKFIGEDDFAEEIIKTNNITRN